MSDVCARTCERAVLFPAVGQPICKLSVCLSVRLYVRARASVYGCEHIRMCESQKYVSACVCVRARARAPVRAYSRVCVCTTLSDQKKKKQIKKPSKEGNTHPHKNKKTNKSQKTCTTFTPVNHTQVARRSSPHVISRGDTRPDAMTHVLQHTHRMTSHVLQHTHRHDITHAATHTPP